MSVLTVSGCSGKSGHETWARANAALKNMLRARRRKEGDFAVYRCRHCGLWHIGSNFGKRTKEAPPDRRWRG